ncbi:MAG: hypothetical protein J5846_07400, partial [Desulfovibrio sp.]|nr:hypothetical protein [Desulfovibrio sp.]
RSLLDFSHRHGRFSGKSQSFAVSLTTGDYEPLQRLHVLRQLPEKQYRKSAEEHRPRSKKAAQKAAFL